MISLPCLLKHSDAPGDVLDGDQVAEGDLHGRTDLRP